MEDFLSNKTFINKYNTISCSMRQILSASHHNQGDLKIVGWEDNVLMSKNMNISQLNAICTKAFTRINRKQLSHRRRKNQWINDIENEIMPQTAHHHLPPKENNLKKFSTLNNDHFSSINTLKKQIENIEKIKDRWQQVYIESQINQKQSKCQKNMRSGLLTSYEKAFDEQDRDLNITKLNFRQINSCQSNRRRPISSIKQNQKKSVTLSEKYSQRSKTIHSRGSNRLFSCNNRNLKLKLKSTRLNITINQLQGKKMESILKILRNHS